MLFVNDGSTDNSWDVIRQTAQAYPQVRGIRFSRAFGKEAALYAGCRPPAATAASRWTVTCSTP